MGCCMSNEAAFFEKETVYEVVLDANGVAQRVPKGQGTHFIHESPDQETQLKEKTSIAYPSATYQKKLSSLLKPNAYQLRIHPSTGKA
ncbi:hypothetical protein BY458DRAFT_527827 [Sporodiniella umbellata]|nr:hypothetical protein BY458DRAFT_527827 [Sporodiniella umbellata]